MDLATGAFQCFATSLLLRSRIQMWLISGGCPLLVRDGGPRLARPPTVPVLLQLSSHPAGLRQWSHTSWTTQPYWGSGPTRTLDLDQTNQTVISKSKHCHILRIRKAPEIPPRKMRRNGSIPCIYTCRRKQHTRRHRGKAKSTSHSALSHSAFVSAESSKSLLASIVISGLHQIGGPISLLRCRPVMSC